MTPLIYAAFKTSNSETLQILLDKGADISILNYAQRTVLQHAVRINNIDAVEVC